MPSIYDSDVDEGKAQQDGQDAPRPRVLLKVRDEESRRNLKWLSFTKIKTSFGFKHLSPAFVPSMASDVRGIAVSFEKVCGWSVPEYVIQEFGKGNYEITVQLSLSMFHLNSSSFFGSTWMGPPITLGNGNNFSHDTIDFEYTEILYMLTKIVDPSCVGVIEIVVSKFDPKKNLVAAQFGCGWTMLNYFSKPFPPDIALGHENVDLTSCAIFYGSPRDLIVNNDLKSLARKLKEIPNCSLFLKLYSHKKLLKIQKLVAENEAINRFDVVAGLLPKYIVPPGGTKPKLIACIGDEELMDNKSGVYCIPTFPTLMQMMSLRIANCQLFIPNRTNLELMLSEYINKVTYEGKEENRAQILNRTLSFGLHNGHTLVGGKWQKVDLVEDREDMDILITSEQLLSLTYFAPHECMAVVCLVEYSIGPPELRNSRYDSESTVRASIQRSHDITEVTLGVAMYVPCDGYNLLLKNTVDSADDGVDIEIKLTNDMDICSILSPKPVVRTKDGEVTVVKTKTDLNVSQDLSKSTKLKGETTMLLGFDLRAIHPSQGELMHKSDLTDIKQSATLDENYDEKNEHEEKTAKFESSRRSEDMETINFGRRSNGGSFKVTGSKISMKDKPEFDLDDNQSVLSIVTGDSDGSALRIDPLYYTSQHPKTILADTHVEYVGLTHPKSKPSLIPNNKSSLLAMSMQTKLGVKKMNENEDDVLKENRIYADRGKLQQASKTPFISAASNQMHNRELSRGMRSRLNRHGFNEAILDSDFSRISRMLPKTNGSANYHVVDIQDEASDELSLHEISIQFAGIRQNAVNGRISGIEKVKRIYCSYQFYSCNPTRTEIMRLLPSNNASTSLLARDEAYAQDEAPLALRYMVDCSLSPTEAFEFTEYLAHQTLYIEVWDSDSTILLGISGVPLRKLLRHKESFQKNTIECDIINPYLQDQRLQDLSCTISMAGPILGVVVGALQVIVSNYGHPGSQPLRENKSIDQDIDLNWRTSNDLKQDKTRNRPKNSVRAKPLSESSPELSKALSDIRYSAVKASSSMRSIAGIRGLESANTLTYDEVSVLFRRFQGSLKGTVQYVGDMMKLLDVPSYNLAIRKLIRCYALFNDLPGFKKELKKYSSVDDRLELKDLEEFFRFLFERMGIYFRKEETKVLANRLDDCLKPMNCEKVVDFIVEEADRQEFTILSLKLRKIAEKAYMDGEDIEQMLSSYDKSGIHFIAIKDFQLFLNGMSKYGRLSARDISLCCKHFSRKGNDTDRPPISLREVMAFFGKDYVGNIAVRLRKILDRRLSIIDCPRNLFIALQEHSSHRSVRLTYEELEDFLGKQGVYDDLSHDQVRKAIVNMDMSRCGEVSGQQMLNYLNVPFSSTDIESSKVRLDSIPQTEVTTEALLRILLEKVQTNGGAVDATFRHFDANGDGSISKKELVSGLSNLKIFDHIPDWKKQIPELVKKFDSSEDGLVSLKEFFAFLGINDYAPNIIQRMTKIFAVATQKGLSIKDIFVELDSDGSGELDQTELISGLKKLGTFGEISNDDAAAVIEVFDVDGDKKISLTEFVDFFSARVEQVLKERREKQAEALAKRFRSVMQAAQRQGVSARDIFYHFDKDKGGTLSTKELADGLTALPNFKALSNRDINDLVGILDSDGNGDVSVDEFESFVNDEMENCSSRPVTLLERVQNMFKTAEAKGLTFQKAFSLIDTDKNGQLSLKELETCLLKLPSFNALDTKEIKQLFDTIDIDGSGLISIDEFKKYVLEGKTVTERRRAAQIDTGKNVERKPEISDSKESFIRHLQRIAEIDGSITRLLAYLDDDEDGLISTAMLKTLLRRENVFDTLSEDIVDSLLQPMLTADNQIKVSVLLRYVEGRESQEVISIEYKDSEPEQDYEFSHDPEIKAIEKKIRSFGRFLASKGVNVESLFQNYDTKSSGVVRRTEFVEILSQLGMHLLEQGKVFEQAHGIETDSRKMQIKQINRIKGNESSFASYAPRMARKMLMSGGEQKDGEFKDHLESMTLVKWYRQSQKQMLLQRVLSHSLASVIDLYPRFGKTIYFEYPITNPFPHEERFMVDIADPELRIVTSFDEWLHLRRNCRPCVGELGSEPVEADMFDQDSEGRVQIVLLANETLHIPFTFLTLVPYTGKIQSLASNKILSSRKEDQKEDFKENDLDDVHRIVNVKFISGSHGHLISILKVQIHPRPLILNRVIRFYESENSIMKRRIQLIGHPNDGHYESLTPATKYVHCVEGTDGSGSAQNRVVIEWGPSGGENDLIGNLDILLRYRCGSFPFHGSFFILVYSDPYQTNLFEIWSVHVHTCQKVDVHATVGSLVSTDLIIRGDKYARRAKAFSSVACLDTIKFQPEKNFQLVPGAYNRLSVIVNPIVAGSRRIVVNVVDVDSKDLLSSWILMLSVTTPAIGRKYDVEVFGSKVVHKKIVFKNPWDVPRRFILTSSDEEVMQPRSSHFEVAPNGSTYLRLSFNSSAGETKEVMLFLNDAETGQNEETYSFRVIVG